MSQIEDIKLVLDPAVYHDVIVNVQLDFKPIGLALKCEDENEQDGGPVGPLFYRGDKFSDTYPVVFDKTIPGISREFGSAWVTYSEAKRIAKVLNLPLVVE